MSAKVANQRERERESEKVKLKVIGKICKKLEGKGQLEKKDIVYRQLVEAVKQREFATVMDTLKEMDFANVEAIPLLYGYRALEITDNNETADEVAKEYRSGRLDPKLAMICE